MRCAGMVRVAYSSMIVGSKQGIGKLPLDKTIDQELFLNGSCHTCIFCIGLKGGSMRNICIFAIDIAVSELALGLRS